MLKKNLFVVISCSVTGIAMSQTREQEANLKAAFIYNFTKYVGWEKEHTETNFVIGIIGDSPISGPLTEIARTKTVGNKKIIIRHFDDPEDISYCHILFIPQQIPFSLRSVLDRVDTDMLTIGEEPGFAEQGTSFNFVIVNNKLKFEANLKALYLAGLKASSQLLKLAIIVN